MVFRWQAGRLSVERSSNGHTENPSGSFDGTANRSTDPSDRRTRLLTARMAHSLHMAVFLQIARAHDFGS